jgi:hypothetical protein
MLALPDMLDLFVNKLSSLRGRRLPLACVLASPVDCFLFRHGNLRDLLCTYASAIGASLRSFCVTCRVI